MKARVFLLILLVGGMILGMPTKSYADPQLDTLLNIATQARDSLGNTISQINNVPDEISQLYKQGSNETDELAQAAAQQDVSSAKQHFLAAMKFFKETNDQINALNSTSPSNDQQRIEIIQLRGEVIRLENMGNLLKSIASQNNVDINFTSFDEMLQNANQDLNSGNLDDASTQVQNANNFVVTTHDSLTEIAQERISERAKDFTEKQIAQLNVSQSTLNATSNQNNTGSSNSNQANVTQNTTPTNSSITAPITNNSNITISSNPNAMVAELKELVAEGKVDQAINLIKIIQAYQKEQSAEQLAQVAPAVNNTVPIPPSAASNDATLVPLPLVAPVNNTVSTHILPPLPPVPVNNTVPIPPPVPPANITYAPLLPPMSANNTIPLPSPPVNNTAALPPPVNNTVPAPPSQTQTNQTESGHGGEHNDYGKRHEAGNTTPDKKHYHQN